MKLPDLIKQIIDRLKGPKPCPVRVPVRWR